MLMLSEQDYGRLLVLVLGKLEAHETLGTNPNDPRVRELTELSARLRTLTAISAGEHVHTNEEPAVRYEAFEDRSDHPAHGHYVSHQHRSSRGQVRGPDHFHYVLCTLDHPELEP